MTAYYKRRQYTKIDPDDPILESRKILDPFQTEVQYYDEREQTYRTRTVYDVSNSRVSEDMFKTPIFNNTVNNNNIDKQPIMETQYRTQTGKFNNETLNVESLVSVLRNDTYETREVLTEFKPKFTRRYYNRSFKDVSVLDRSSVLQNLDSLMGRPKIKQEELLVFDTYSFGVLEEAKKIQETMLHRNPIFNLSDSIYEGLIAELTRSIENCNSPFNDITVTIQHRIPLGTLDVKESIYCKDVDILITKARDFGVLPHPYSDAAKRYNIVPPEIREVTGVGMTYLVVDNENQVKQRWVNIGSETMPIPVVRNPSMESGVYYYQYNSLDDKIDLRDIKLKYVAFDEAEESLGVYAYKEDAETLGNRGHKDQMAIAERKKEIERMQHDNKVMEHDLNTSKAYLQAKLDKLKHEYDKEKAELDRELLDQKREYENIHHLLTMEKSKAQSELDRLKYEHDRIEHKLSMDKTNAQAEVERLKHENSKRKEELEAIQHELAMEKSKAQSELERLKQDNAERKEALEKAQSEFSLIESRQKREYDQLQHELAIEKARAQAEVERLKNDNAKRKEALEKAQSEFSLIESRQKREYDQLQHELAMEKSRAQSELERLKQDNAIRKEELEKLQHRNKTLESKLAKEKALLDGTISKEKYKEERKSMKRKAAAEARKLEEELSRLKAEKDLLESRAKSELESIERKAEKAEREMENLRHKSELERNQMMMALEMSKMTQARESEKHYLDMEKIDMQGRALRRADYYDERSHDRKDSSEFIKWVPAVLAGAGALGMWANKNRS